MSATAETKKPWNDVIVLFLMAAVLSIAIFIGFALKRTLDSSNHRAYLQGYEDGAEKSVSMTRDEVYDKFRRQASVLHSNYITLFNSNNEYSTYSVVRIPASY